MDTKKIGIFAILSLSIVAVLTGTTGMSLLSPVFAGGDYHDHDGKKCKKNEDNNCNDTENNQKLTPKEECDNETTIKDHSKKNDNGNVLVCRYRCSQPQRFSATQFYYIWRHNRTNFLVGQFPNKEVPYFYFFYLETMACRHNNLLLFLP